MSNYFSTLAKRDVDKGIVKTTFVTGPSTAPKKYWEKLENVITIEELKQFCKKNKGAWLDVTTFQKYDTKISGHRINLPVLKFTILINFRDYAKECKNNRHDGAFFNDFWSVPPGKDTKIFEFEDKKYVVPSWYKIDSVKKCISYVYGWD